jgi:deoxyribodipyrimidine photo-lyase
MTTAVMWFRRDLRDHDNAALFRALDENERVYCLFVFDTDILKFLSSASHRRFEFLHASVRELKQALKARGSDLIVLHGSARTEVLRIAVQLGVTTVYANHDYEPTAIARDATVRQSLERCGVAFKTYKDTVVFEKDELLTQSGTPFSVFTPYRNAWLKKVSQGVVAAKPANDHAFPTLEELGFAPSNLKVLGIRPGMSGAATLIDDFKQRIDHYKTARNFPGVPGVSYLSVHNRFGTCSIRELARLAMERDGEGAKTWLSELIWRDFYFQVLWHHPRVVTSAFKPKYDNVSWRNDERHFRAWCEAKTGYPIVDAAMRQLNQTGYMHNRLRMIVASFLTKDLLIDWRWGERYFAEHLNDYDLAANNGGWQWAASTGCDAQPYFRIFNPVSQSERFDPEAKFTRRYVPELAGVPDAFLHAPWTLSAAEQQHLGLIIGKHYPAPILDHGTQRVIALRLFHSAAKGGDAPTR